MAHIRFDQGGAAVIAQGDTYEKALSDVESAIRFRAEIFGEEVLEVAPARIIEAFVAAIGE